MIRCNFKLLFFFCLIRNGSSTASCCCQLLFVCLLLCLARPCLGNGLTLSLCFTCRVNSKGFPCPQLLDTLQGFFWSLTSSGQSPSVKLDILSFSRQYLQHSWVGGKIITNNLYNTECQALCIYTWVNSFNFHSSYMKQNCYYSHTTDEHTGEIS